ncbi:MAG TPA: nucleotidyltransferase domain-containing protein, partial [Gammaproteobacteria bacterium]|nr:nucleotidyltransferase domain-containing protein [Gammaproteobacteria bacterium]
MTEVVNYLQQRGDIKQAILFGSLATGREGADSDIDLAIEKDHRLIADEIVELIEQL